MRMPKRYPKRLPNITDHALLRYLERVKGVDTRAIRQEISGLVEGAVERGATGVYVAGLTFVLEDVNVITCVSGHVISKTGAENG